MNQQDYYKILGLEPDCTDQQIKARFRLKAKEYHPDTANSSEDASRMHLLIQAYRVLSNPSERERYDRSRGILRGKPGEKQFDYEAFLREQNTPQALAKLLLHTLLHDRDEEALGIYEELLMKGGLEAVMEREDFMDCAYMLAEEYERQRGYEQALRLLLDVVRSEEKKPYFRHFFPEVLERIRTIALNKLPKTVTVARLVSWYQKLVDCRLSDSDSVRYLEQLARLYRKEKRGDLASACEEMARRLGGRESEENMRQSRSKLRAKER